MWNKIQISFINKAIKTAQFVSRYMLILKSVKIFIIFVLVQFTVYSQSKFVPDTVRITNPSFEDSPKMGTLGLFPTRIKNWEDCGLRRFEGETPPDIHPGNFWENNLPPSEGNTYIGMVVRDNDTWEGVSQRLSAELKGGKCYKFSADLALAPQYLSLSRMTLEKSSYTKPAVLRIWGGNGICSERELLAESESVNHNQWRRYEFVIHPRQNHAYILVEAFYRTPVVLPYNGHILLDNMSHFIEIPCPQNSIAGNVERAIGKEIVEDTTPKEVKSINVEKDKSITIVKNSSKKDSATKLENSSTETESGQKKKKILEDLDINKLSVGKTIIVKNLFFEADKATINEESYEVLDEILDFIRTNPDVVIEIGGHTNGIPKHDYCNKLSTERAKEVYDYLVKKGAPPQNLRYKGYGKTRRIASDTTPEGREKNQRVEIKILKIK